MFVPLAPAFAVAVICCVLQITFIVLSILCNIFFLYAVFTNKTARRTCGFVLFLCLTSSITAGACMSQAAESLDSCYAEKSGKLLNELNSPCGYSFAEFAGVAFYSLFAVCLCLGQDQGSVRMAVHHRRRGTPPPQTNSDNLVGPLLVHKLLGPRPPGLPSSLLIHPWTRSSNPPEPAA